MILLDKKEKLCIVDINNSVNTIRNMSVKFIAVGSLKRFFNNVTDGKDRLVVEDREGRSVKAVCQEIGLPVNLISLYIVNGKAESKDYILQPDDEIKLIAAMGGG
jgi:molybdopterin converting factor small subunit